MLISRLHAKIRDVNENDRLILFNALGAFVVKGGALVVSLLTMPAFIRYFENHEILGLWFTILSVLSWVLTFDLGIGSGLRNHLVAALSANDQTVIKKYISSAYLTIGIIASVAIAAAVVLFGYLDWNVIFNISAETVSRSTLNRVVLIVFFGIMLQFFSKLITSVLYAMQKSALNNLLTLIGSILIYVYLLFAKFSDVTTSLVTMAVFYVLAVNGPMLAATVIVFSRRLKGCRPEIRFWDRKYAKDIMKLGGMFFWIQMMYVIIAASNEYLITWLTGPEHVVDYQIYNRLFTLIGTVFYLALTPIWSAVTKAQTERNFTWIRKLYRTLKTVSLIAILGEFALILVLQLAINLWLGVHAIQVNYLFAVIFALSGSIYIWNGVNSSIANGCGQLKGQTIFFTLGAVVNIPLAFVLVSIMQSWIGVVLSNVLSLLVYCVVQPIWLDRFIRDQERKTADDQSVSAGAASVAADAASAKAIEDRESNAAALDA